MRWRAPLRRCSPMRPRGVAWARPHASGPWPSSRTTSSPPASGAPSTAWEDDSVAVKARADDLDADPASEAIINGSWAGTGLYVAVAIAGTIFVDSFATPTAVVSGALFVVGCVAFFWAYAV